MTEQAAEIPTARKPDRRGKDELKLEAMARIVQVIASLTERKNLKFPNIHIPRRHNWPA